jgi:hypothetical protein
MNSNSSVNYFSSNENKALLWSVLHGGGKFSGIPEIQVQNIQIMFETIIRDMCESYRKSNQLTDLNGMNKEAIITICKKIETMKSSPNMKQQQQQQQQQQQPIYQKKQQMPPQLETIYRAEDIQKERQNSFNMELKKKEEEMASIITLKKPEEINFTDDIYDKPIGDDMERLLAETLASRERELEQLTNVTSVSSVKPPPPPQSNPNSSSNSNFVKYKTEMLVEQNTGKGKRVSFGNELRVTEHGHDTSHEYNNNPNFENESESDSDLNFIFNKIKKIKNIKNIKEKNVNESDSSDNKIIIKISEDIVEIKNNLTELIEKMNKIYEMYEKNN